MAVVTVKAMKVSRVRGRTEPTEGRIVTNFLIPSQVSAANRALAAAGRFGTRICHRWQFD